MKKTIILMLAILLLIIVMGLTVINNRIASKRVFYG